MKLKKNIPLIDQHDKYGFWGGKFGGSFIPETLKKPVEDLTKEFQKLRKNNVTPQKNLHHKLYIHKGRSYRFQVLNLKFENQIHSNQ